MIKFTGRSIAGRLVFVFEHLQLNGTCIDLTLSCYLWYHSIGHSFPSFLPLLLFMPVHPNSNRDGITLG